jgi:hypothetical protein
MIIFGFVGVGETMAAGTAQDNNNQTNFIKSDKQKIIVTWLETNDTKMYDAPAMNVSREDFWKMFEPLRKEINEDK